MVRTIAPFHSVIGALLLLVSDVAVAERQLRDHGEATYSAPFTAAATGFWFFPQGGCQAPERCESQAFADAATGVTSCSSDVDRLTAPGITAMGWATVEQEIAVPKHTRQVKVQAVWHVHGAADAEGEAMADAFINMHVFKGDTIIARAFGHGPHLFVHGQRPQIKTEDREVKTSIANADIEPRDRPPFTLLIRTTVTCHAGAGNALAVVDAGLPGRGHVELFRVPDSSPPGTRLKEIRVQFYR